MNNIKTRRRHCLGLLAAALAFAGFARAGAEAQEVNLYSSRHYDSDRALYEAFTKETGIRVRLIEGDADQLIERIRTEGANSPADVFITVDAARLARAAAAGILQPYRSAAVESRIPPGLRDAEGMWFAVSQRARVVMYDKEKGRPEGLARYEDMADPRFRGQICARSGNHPYNISLAASILAANGSEKTEEWAKGVVANMARPPQGGDRDQFRAIPAGQCGLAISNTYYLARLAASEKPEDKEVAEKVAVFFPNQDGRGTHVNVSGAAVVKTAPNKENGIKLIEYLASPEAQRYFADTSLEYPANPEVKPHPVLASWGEFKQDTLNPSVYAKNASEAARIMDRCGWK